MIPIRHTLHLLLLASGLLLTQAQAQTPDKAPLVLQVTGDSYFYQWNEDGVGSGDGDAYGGTIRLSGIGSAGYSLHFSLRGGELSPPGGLNDSDLLEIDTGIIGPITDHLFWSLGYYFISNEGEYAGFGGVGTFDATAHALPIGLIAAYPIDLGDKLSMTPRLALAIGPGYSQEEGTTPGGAKFDISEASLLFQSDAQLTLEYKVTPSFSLHADGGYRYMRVGDTELHGPFVRAGFRIAF